MLYGVSNVRASLSRMCGGMVVALFLVYQSIRLYQQRIGAIVKPVYQIIVEIRYSRPRDFDNVNRMCPVTSKHSDLDGNDVAYSI